MKRKFTHKVKWEALEKYCAENQSTLPDSIPNNIRDWTRLKVMYNLFMMSYKQRLKHKDSIKADLIYFTGDESWANKIVHSKLDRMTILNTVTKVLGYKNSVAELSEHLVETKIESKNNKPSKIQVTSIPNLKYGTMNFLMSWKITYTPTGELLYRKFGLNLLRFRKIKQDKTFKVMQSKWIHPGNVKYKYATIKF